MTVGGEVQSKKYFRGRKMNLHKAIMKYRRLIVFIRHDSAEIWGFRFGFTLFIGTLNIMARTCVFVRVVCALRHSIKNFLFSTKHDFDLNKA
jgi:hypothetical protein